VNANKQSWKIPSYYQLDVNLGYEIPIGQKEYKLAFRLNFMNVTNVVYISDAQNNGWYDTNIENNPNPGFNAQSAGVFMGMGFRWNTGVSFTF